ncbi:HPr family phosphocarrier protein [Alkalihalobacterium chitinilyticum]|uniref:HPr family phosphocarrier protein n=1 Tax=Alkalihalobacterium chitinilyticum TaxID=2980103 RepID=A0ABT5VFE4_9BACI|nr:HPr family phosphocarrier protein [Alkalihalobacterium chitinilyticum]MDE5413173.1 HPr family phosphocarrier protein [Alkalihalobacterium chitinilyticum]
MKLEKELIFPKGFTVRKVIELVTANERFASKIYFQTKSHQCNGKSMLGLMSFMLMTTIGESYIISVEGEDAEKVIQFWNKFVREIHENTTLSYWEEEGAQTVQEAMCQSISFWNSSVRSVAQSYLKPGKKEI